MALDSATIHLLAGELSGKLTGGRIEKIQQPEKDLLIFTIRADGANHRLLMRTSGPNARIHLTSRSFENPAMAPMFCMLLRKHLSGARLSAVEQLNGDRLISFALESRNELGDPVEFKLIAELMGRAANVVLISADGRILDCLRRIPPSDYGHRALLPGLRYELPELPNGHVRNTDGNRETEELPADSSFSISSMLDNRYGALEQQELQRRRSQELVKAIRRSRDRHERKLAAQTEELRRTEKMEATRQMAELLQANLYRVQRGDRLLSCENYYLDGSPHVTIELDPTKTPQQNLAARFKEYRKLKGAKEHLTELIEDGKNQLDYLNSVLDELSRTETTQELDEIRRELESTGWIKASGQGKKKKSTSGKHSPPLRFESPDGMEILVGRNNLQNDELTFHTARRTDYWLHIRNQHGSHVILRCEGQEPSASALQAAAELAAFYSQARSSGKTAVDYTMVRNVKKQSGALPGKVTYLNYQTIIVDSNSTGAGGEQP